MTHQYYLDKIFRAFPKWIVINKIEHHEKLNGREQHTYTVTFIRTRNNPIEFESAVNDFCEFLKSIVINEDIFSTDNECFSVINEKFVVSFYAEGYKNADRKAYWDSEENGIKISPLNRMGVRTAIQYCKKYNVPIDKIKKDMLDKKTMKEIPNSADRFVYLVKKEYNFNKWCKN